MRDPEINYSANSYKTKVFGIIKTDQIVEMNESFGFRMKIDLEPSELLKLQKEDRWGETPFNYESVPFYLETHLYSLKCRFWDLKQEEILDVFNSGKLKRIQTKTLSLKSPVKSLWKYLFMNFKGDYLSHWNGTIHSWLVNFQQSNSNKLHKASNMQKENEDYVHIGLKSSKISLSKTLTENPFQNSQPLSSVEGENQIIKIKRLDKVLLDKDGNRYPSNLTEFLFGDPHSGYYLLRDNNLKWYVKYEEVIRVFGKVLKPLYKSYDNIKQQYKELISWESVKEALGWNQSFIKGIEELHLFTISASEAELQNELNE